jgi:ribosomal RNA-processing protein 7
MPKKPTEISGYTVLPLRLPATPSFPSPATHYLYLRPHEPRIPDADAARSLFLVNLPIDTTELHLRHLFSSQLSAGRVEHVHFGTTTSSTAAVTIPLDNEGQGKKRKRTEPTASDLQSQLSNVALPSAWDRALQASGSHAIVTFVDRPAMEASLKAARKAARAASKSKSTDEKKEKGTVAWSLGIEDRVSKLGVHRYQKHCSQLRFPDPDELLGIVNEYMSLFAQTEESRARESARRAQEPDEDGFVTVTKGPRLTDLAAREDEVKELVEKQKKREEGLGDFYRFQTREKRKERQNELLRRFDEDRRKIETLKRGRGGIMVFFSSFLPLII